MLNGTFRSIDDALGPFFDLSGVQSFDFTQNFEEIIFLISPVSFLLLIIPARLAHLRSESPKVIGNWERTSKVVRDTFCLYHCRPIWPWIVFIELLRTSAYRQCVCLVVAPSVLYKLIVGCCYTLARSLHWSPAFVLAGTCSQYTTKLYHQCLPTFYSSPGRSIYSHTLASQHAYLG